MCVELAVVRWGEILNPARVMALSWISWLPSASKISRMATMIVVYCHSCKQSNISFSTAVTR